MSLSAEDWRCQCLRLSDEVAYVTYLDWHTSRMISYWKQNSLAPHSLEPSSEFDLANCERVPKMKATVHVGVWECPEPFGVCLLDGFHRLIRFEKLRIAMNVLR